MSEIRWGIVGAGGIADVFAPDIATVDGNRAVAVAARDAGRAAAFAAKHRIERSYGSYTELFADPEVDVVYVATTHTQHRDLAIEAMRAGKPALIEKPLTLNAGQAREVVAVARETGVFCMEGMWMRLHPSVRQAVQLAKDGRIGDVTAVRADLSRLFPFDPSHRLFDLAIGGGALLDLGVYPTHFAWLVLGRPDTVQAIGSLSPTGSDLTAAMNWGYADGRVAQIFCSAAGPSPYTALITGTGGWIRLETRIHRPTAITVHTDDGDEVIEAEPPVGGGFGHEIAEVARCLREGLTESPLVPLDETVEILEVLDEARAQLGVTYAED
jgi:predicted dehydrogenase